MHNLPYLSTSAVPGAEYAAASLNIHQEATRSINVKPVGSTEFKTDSNTAAALPAEPNNNRRSNRADQFSGSMLEVSAHTYAPRPSALGHRYHPPVVAHKDPVPTPQPEAKPKHDVDDATAALLALYEWQRRNSSARPTVTTMWFKVGANAVASDPSQLDDDGVPGRALLSQVQSVRAYMVRLIGTKNIRHLAEQKVCGEPKVCSSLDRRLSTR